MTTLELDPSRPYQTQGKIIAFRWPRGRGRYAAAGGLIAIADVGQNPTCSCTEAQLQALRIGDRAVQAVLDGGSLRISWRNHEDGPPFPEPGPEARAGAPGGGGRSPGRASSRLPGRAVGTQGTLSLRLGEEVQALPRDALAGSGATLEGTPLQPRMFQGDSTSSPRLKPGDS